MYMLWLDEIGRDSWDREAGVVDRILKCSPIFGGGEAVTESISSQGRNVSSLGRSDSSHGANISACFLNSGLCKGRGWLVCFSNFT